jgi:hypothetical protein
MVRFVFRCWINLWLCVVIMSYLKTQSDELFKNSVWTELITFFFREIRTEPITFDFRAKNFRTELIIKTCSGADSWFPLADLGTVKHPIDCGHFGSKEWSPPPNAIRNIFEKVDLWNSTFKNDVTYDALRVICNKNLQCLRDSAIMTFSAICALEKFKVKTVYPSKRNVDSRYLNLKVAQLPRFNLNQQTTKILHAVYHQKNQVMVNLNQIEIFK